MEKINLNFDINNYVKEEYEFEGKRIQVRSYYDLDYCANPLDSIQKMNLFVPEAYYNNETINGYSRESAPIFMPNTVGGYMPGPADKPSNEQFGRVNSIFYALEHGYVVASAGVRGRTTGKKSQEFFQGGSTSYKGEDTGKMVGRAPAFVVDMKAAVRYLRHNKDAIIGDVSKIFTNGTSAGGALSALMGASGDNPGYEKYLDEIGALNESDAIFGASCYCPIHNLEHADMAYEWLFNKEDTFHMSKKIKTDNGIERIPWDEKMPASQMTLSDELAAMFPEYVNSLHLKGEDGTELLLDENGQGSFKGYIISLLCQSARDEYDSHKYADKGDWLTVAGSRVENQDFLSFENDKLVGIDFDAFVKAITRMKPVPAFDHLDLTSPENEEFGDKNVEARHFTKFALEHSVSEGELASKEIIKLMNPTKLIQDSTSTVAKHWRIRHGAYDRDTALAIPVILQLMLKNKGFDVDFALPWGVPHRGDYDLEDLFAWIDNLCK